MLYLDYNATAPLRPEVIDAMQPWLAGPHNPSSIHAAGRKARMAVERARESIASAIGADPANLIFTASGSEANNHALHAAKPTALFVSAIEHASILTPAKESGLPHHLIPVDANGLVRPDALDALLTENPSAKPLVSVMFANNETGVIQPLEAVIAIARKHHAIMHVDAAQALGRVPLNIGELGADLVTLSAHKMGGPVGAAALVQGSCFGIEPFIFGGGQEKNRRAGTENLPAIVGFAKAVECIDLAFMEKLAIWRDAMEAAILAVAPGAAIFGKNAPRLPTTSNLSMPRGKDGFVASHTQLMAFDLAGIAVSSGSACTSGKVGNSHVLEAMGISKDEADSAIRISGGWGSTEADFAKAAECWLKQHKQSANMKGAA
ncbi:aminotransferase class V-fold PLP-dependent enzyme [bacterium]|nr:aminotransferase class V-fold PLP-dependent enzyme [bacterium]